MQLTEEVYNYGVSDFVAETGGYLGMLVGISAINVYEQMVKIGTIGPVNYVKKYLS